MSTNADRFTSVGSTVSGVPLKLFGKRAMSGFFGAAVVPPRIEGKVVSAYAGLKLEVLWTIGEGTERFWHLPGSLHVEETAIFGIVGGGGDEAGGASSDDDRDVEPGEAGASVWNEPGIGPKGRKMFVSSCMTTNSVPDAAMHFNHFAAIDMHNRVRRAGFALERNIRVHLWSATSASTSGARV